MGSCFSKEDTSSTDIEVVESPDPPSKPAKKPIYTTSSAASTTPTSPTPVLAPPSNTHESITPPNPETFQQTSRCARSRSTIRHSASQPEISQTVGEIHGFEAPTEEQFPPLPPTLSPVRPLREGGDDFHIQRYLSVKHGCKRVNPDFALRLETSQTRPSEQNLKSLTGEERFSQGDMQKKMLNVIPKRRADYSMTSSALKTGIEFSETESKPNVTSEAIEVELNPGSKEVGASTKRRETKGEALPPPPSWRRGSTRDTSKQAGGKVKLEGSAKAGDEDPGGKEASVKCSGCGMRFSSFGSSPASLLCLNCICASGAKQDTLHEMALLGGRTF